jgi:hypothetical protein
MTRSSTRKWMLIGWWVGAACNVTLDPDESDDEDDGTATEGESDSGPIEGGESETTVVDSESGGDSAETGGGEVEGGESETTRGIGDTGGGEGCTATTFSEGESEVGSDGWDEGGDEELAESEVGSDGWYESGDEEAAESEVGSDGWYESDGGFGTEGGSETD